MVVKGYLVTAADRVMLTQALGNPDAFAAEHHGYLVGAAVSTSGSVVVGLGDRLSPGLDGLLEPCKVAPRRLCIVRSACGRCKDQL